ncbi:hypothetical protein RchiOBHm_Chr4g0401691 [Rosa chinensis]|uniref:Uncharacterized protein n=1 Tax=Rosa chinensis TaxID=74649 RepID=A0A2P6QT92_ROSCH|nr:hypothetical protein RchiOBHm_Chr4g0401691 [Rosa chinensis]
MMSTVEVNLPEDGIGGLVCLKFWASDLQNKNFNLSTIVCEPHRCAKGGGLAFLKGNSPSFQQQSIADGKSPQALLAYINADHEYILFGPYDNDARELSMTRGKDCVAVDEIAQYGYASIYGELPQFEMKRDQTLLAPYAPSQRPWETIFSGSSHNLLPLPKLCLEFMESLLERRTTTVE